MPPPQHKKRTSNKTYCADLFHDCRNSRYCSFHSSSPIHDQLQQIAIGVEEVQAIVIAPVNRPFVTNPGLREGRAGALEVGDTDPKRVMPLPERLIDPAQIGWWEILPLEQGKGRAGQIEDNLITEAAGNLQAQQAGVKRLGGGEVAHLDPKVVKPLQHDHRCVTDPASAATH